MIKIRVAAVLTALLFILSGCFRVSIKRDRAVINAGGYHGIALETETVPALPEAVKPPLVTTPRQPAEQSAVVVSEAAQTPTVKKKYNTLNYSTVSGVWISYMELARLYAQLPNPAGDGGEQAFADKFGKMLDEAKALGINTVYVHLRAFGDAMYDSKLYPHASRITGVKSLPYDPLPVMTAEAHKRKMSFQGWLNPLRLYPAGSEPALDGKLKNWYNNRKGTYIVQVGDYTYLNPAYRAVVDFVADGTREIAENYNVDGIHIDDYFYPTTDESFDRDAFAKSGRKDLAQFRLDCVSALVKGMYRAVKSADNTALFGVSPQGSIENNYDLMYADVKKWCSVAGYVDYIAPQVYYGFNNSGQPFEKCVERWQELVRGTKIKLVPGLSVYKIGSKDSWAGAGENEWLEDKEIIRRQIEFCKTQPSFGGVILYSFDYLFSKDFVTPRISDEIAAFKPYLIT